jgi:hypothetical protein
MRVTILIPLLVRMEGTELEVDGRVRPTRRAQEGEEGTTMTMICLEETMMRGKVRGRGRRRRTRSSLRWEI